MKPGKMMREAKWPILTDDEVKAAHALFLRIVDHVGGQRELARRIGCSPQAVQRRLAHGRPPSPEWCNAMIDAAAGMKPAATKRVLRPDFHGPKRVRGGGQ